MFSPWRPCLPLGNPALESFLHRRGALERGSSAISLTPGRCPRLALREVSTEQVSADKKPRFGAGRGRGSYWRCHSTGQTPYCQAGWDPGPSRRCGWSQSGRLRPQTRHGLAESVLEPVPGKEERLPPGLAPPRRRQRSPRW